MTEPAASSAPATPAPLPLRYGVATAAFQVEGGAGEDGRGDSIWDVFCRQPGAIVDGSDGTVACDHAHRVDEDLDLVRDLGVSSYRFSLAWPRVQPDGVRVEPRGLDFYERLVDGVLTRGLEPLPTLYHWDLPAALEERGGWPVRDTAQRFADYTAAVLDRLGDRVQTWASLNEPWCSAFLGYAAGVHAPGRRDPAAAHAAAHHLLLGHAHASRLVRESGGQAGIVLNLAPVHAEPDADPLAVQVVDATQNELWLGALLDGAYPEVLEHLPAVVRDGDLQAIRGSLDWMGINYYTPYRVGLPTDPGIGVGQDADAYPGAPRFAFHPVPPVTTMGWEIDASGMEDLLVGVSRRAPHLPLRVTENGSAWPDDTRGPDGAVQDGERERYLLEHVAAVLRARGRGADVRDYLVWTLLDNFEWAQGYRQTFGLIEVEPGTLRRVPKRSYHAYRALVAAADA